jgi:hypothetical protein
VGPYWNSHAESIPFGATEPFSTADVLVTDVAPPVVATGTAASTAAVPAAPIATTAAIKPTGNLIIARTVPIIGWILPRLEGNMSKKPPSCPLSPH